jgi:hypothetical protein
MPGEMVVQIAAAVVVGQLVVELSDAEFRFAGFVVDMAADMRAVGVARIQCQGAVDILGRPLLIAVLSEREGVLAEAQPFLAVVGKERRGIGENLCLAASPSGEADQAEHGGAGLRDQRVAGVFVQMGPARRTGLGAGVEQQVHGLDVFGLPPRRALRLRHRLL